MSKPLGPSRVKKIFNGTELVLKMCETKNNEWKRYMLLIRDGIDNYIKTTIITSNFASLNNGLKCRKPVFMRLSGICFIKWLWFGSICGRDKGCESTDGEIKA